MGTERDWNPHVCRNPMEFNGSNGKQRCFYHSKLQGSGSAIPDPNPHTDPNAHADPNTNSNTYAYPYANSNSDTNAYPGSNSNAYANANTDSNRNAAT